MAQGATGERTRANHRRPIEAVADAAVASSLRLGARPRAPRRDLLGELATRPDEATAALERMLITSVTATWQRHWQPVDLPRALGHACGPAHARLGAEAVLREACRYPAERLPPRWKTQLEAINPSADGLGLDVDGGQGWVAPHRHESQLLDRLGVAVETVAFLQALPRLPKIGPLPGEAPGSAANGPSGVDAAVVHRVTSLLAKAESTSFPSEAEALTAKAQELMTRHAIDRALVEARRSDRTGGPLTSARRIGVEAPYGSAKAMLLQTIAEANRCRSVWSKDFGFSTVFGDQTDLDTVELLFTSLLVQSARAMIATGPPGGGGGGRTRSFRQSFLVSFATRIGDRLREAVAEAVANSGESPDDLLPVLARRESGADAACQDAFPTTRVAKTTAKDGEGWQAGRRAADRAQLDLYNGIDKSGNDKTMDAALRRGAP